jgi:hypothetical protein
LTLFIVPCGRTLDSPRLIDSLIQKTLVLQLSVGFAI